MYRWNFERISVIGPILLRTQASLIETSRFLQKYKSKLKYEILHQNFSNFLTKNRLGTAVMTSFTSSQTNRLLIFQDFSQKNYNLSLSLASISSFKEIPVPRYPLCSVFEVMGTLKGHLTYRDVKFARKFFLAISSKILII